MFFLIFEVWDSVFGIGVFSLWGLGPVVWGLLGFLGFGLFI